MLAKMINRAELATASFLRKLKKSGAQRSPVNRSPPPGSKTSQRELCELFSSDKRRSARSAAEPSRSPPCESVASHHPTRTGGQGRLVSKQISIAIISFVKNVVTKREEITFEVKVRGQIGWGNVIFDS